MSNQEYSVTCRNSNNKKAQAKPDDVTNPSPFQWAQGRCYARKLNGRNFYNPFLYNIIFFHYYTFTYHDDFWLLLQRNQGRAFIIAIVGLVRGFQDVVRSVTSYCHFGNQDFTYSTTDLYQVWHIYYEVMLVKVLQHVGQSNRFRQFKIDIRQFLSRPPHP